MSSLNGIRVQKRTDLPYSETERPPSGSRCLNSIIGSSKRKSSTVNTYIKIHMNVLTDAKYRVPAFDAHAQASTNTVRMKIQSVSIRRSPATNWLVSRIVMEQETIKV